MGGDIQPLLSRDVNLLVINPNSSRAMTIGLDKMIKDLGYGRTTTISTYSAPSGPHSINNEDDALESAHIVYKDLELIKRYDACLVACYSVHPLVGMLQSGLGARTPVIGIFEASVSTALALLPRPKVSNTGTGSTTTSSKFGIVTTGKYWEAVLTEGVLDYLGCADLAGCRRFKRVESTGLNASELHTAPAEEVRRRMMDATKRLVSDGDVRAICLGCAGMAGMDAMVRSACIEELGKEQGESVHIIDGVKAGIAILDGLVRA
ncbi:MAG: hypothetical protein M1818_003896 [Claussenomyces sp. TS43310]|nr:MAG: hypothetical protein M1818_003896 [Claussenomyces sp. TS43310]